MCLVSTPNIRLPRQWSSVAVCSPFNWSAEVQWPTATSLISPQQRILMEQMTDGLKPVTHSMSAALNALRHTLPGSETPARSS